MDWNDLKFALAVAQHGSLSAAGRALGTSQPTVSRRLDRFERRIGVKLFERDKDGMSPTSIGLEVIDGLRAMEEGALAVERRIASRETGLQGRITVTSLDWLGDHVVAPIAGRFGALNPLVTIDLINDTRLFNLSRRDADIAFRFGSFQQEDLVLRKVADVAYGLYASNKYLENRGRPDFVNGGAGHALVLLHDDAGRVCYREWLKQMMPKALVTLRTNGVQSHFAAVESGEAMAALPRVVADRRPGLMRLETPVPEPVQSVRMGVHSDMRETPRIRAFIDFAVAELTTRENELNPRT